MLFVLLEGDYLLICFFATRCHVVLFSRIASTAIMFLFTLWVSCGLFFNEPARCFHYAAMLSGPMAAARDVMSQFRFRNPVMLNTCRYGESCDNQLL